MFRRTGRILCLIGVLVMIVATPKAYSQMTVTTMPETSAAWPAGYIGYGIFVSQTSDLLGPFNGQSVWYRGFQLGGSSETLNGGHLVYRYRIDFMQSVHITSVDVSGAGDYKRAASTLRLLDKNRNVLATLDTTGFGGGVLDSYTLNAGGATGQTFFIDEFDSSTDARYRDHISIAYKIAINAPASLTVSPVSSTKLKLKWNYGSDPIDGFIVERKLGGVNSANTYQKISVSPATQPYEYTDSGLTPNTTYTYRVSAYKGSDTSTPSQEASGTTADKPTITVHSIGMAGAHILEVD